MCAYCVARRRRYILCGKAGPQVASHRVVDMCLRNIDVEDTLMNAMHGSLGVATDQGHRICRANMTCLLVSIEKIASQRS